MPRVAPRIASSPPRCVSTRPDELLTQASFPLFAFPRQTSADAGISAFPDGDNIFSWIGTIEGAAGTVRRAQTRPTQPPRRRAAKISQRTAGLFHPRTCRDSRCQHPRLFWLSPAPADPADPSTILSPTQVYEGLTYKLSLAFPNDYPFKSPTVKFETPCFHPNVDQFGNICLDILKEKWSAVYNVRTILLSIQSLLGEPNNQSPLNAQAAQLWENQEDYKKTLHKKYREDTK